MGLRSIMDRNICPLFVDDNGAIVYAPGSASQKVINSTGVTGAMSGGGLARRVIAGNTTTYTLDENHSARIYIATLGSGTQTYTLPLASAQNGVFFTFICGDAAGEIRVIPSGSDTISIKATVDQGASVVTSAGAGIKNTAATNVLNDSVTLISDGTSQWYMLDQSGIWAAI